MTSDPRPVCPVRPSGVAAGCLALALLAGCGPRPDPPVDPADAGQHLRAALDAWKAGRPHDSLAVQDPPVVFNEPLWRDGQTALLDYELGDVELHGRQGRCTARLKLRAPDGKTSERKIGYQIDTIPRVVIVREALGP